MRRRECELVQLDEEMTKHSQRLKSHLKRIKGKRDRFTAILKSSVEDIVKNLRALIKECCALKECMEEDLHAFDRQFYRPLLGDPIQPDIDRLTEARQFQCRVIEKRQNQIVKPGEAVVTVLDRIIADARQAIERRVTNEKTTQRRTQAQRHF